MKSFNEFLNEKSYKDTFRVKKEGKFLTVGWKMGKVSFTPNKQISYPFQDEKSAEKAAKEHGGEVFSYSEIFEDLKTKEIDPSKFSNDGPMKDDEFFKKGKKDGDFNDDVIETKRFSIPAKALKPSQDAIYLSKALDMAINNIVGGDLNAMVSRDNYILDGHHRWAATMFGNPNAKVQGMQSNLTIGDLVPVLRKAGDALGNERGVEPKGGDTNIYKATIQDIEDAVYTGKNMNPKYYNKDASIAWYETLGKDLVEKRLKVIQSKKLPAGAPARKDMPKIEPEQVAKIASDLNGGKIDARFPYVKEQKSNKTMKSLNEFLNEKKSNIQTGDVVKWKKGYADSKAEASKVYDVLSDPDSFGFVKIRDRNSKITGTIESAKINFLEKIESLGQEEFDRLKELEKEIDDIKKGKKEGKIIPLDKERKSLLRKLKTGTSSYIHKHGPNKGNPIREEKIGESYFATLGGSSPLSQEAFEKEVKKFGAFEGPFTTFDDEGEEIIRKLIASEYPNHIGKGEYDFYMYGTRNGDNDFRTVREDGAQGYLNVNSKKDVIRGVFFDKRGTLSGGIYIKKTLYKKINK